MRPGYERLAGLDEALDRVQQLSVQTVIFDIEPLVAYWDSGQEALDQGVARVVGLATAVPAIKVVCFSTNSLRQPSFMPAMGPQVRVVYLVAAGKPLRTSQYRDFPRPGAVIGDQVATDGILARRLGYTYLECPWPDHMPPGPRVMHELGSLVRPLVFTRHGG
jgi:predicted HAD superfamily phosphohydrolase YqeG